MQPGLLLVILLSLGGGGLASPVLTSNEVPMMSENFLNQSTPVNATTNATTTATTTIAAPATRPTPNDPTSCSKQCKEEFGVCPPIVTKKLATPHVLYYWGPHFDRKKGYNPISLQLSDRTYLAHCYDLQNNSLEFDIARNGGPLPVRLEIPAQILNASKIKNLVEHARIAQALMGSFNCSTMNFVTLVIGHGLFTPASKWNKTFSLTNYVGRSPRELFDDVDGLVNRYDYLNCSGVRKIGDTWGSGRRNSDASFLIVTVVTCVGIFLTGY